MAINGLRFTSGQYATQGDLATNAGLNLITTQSFSAVSSVSLDNVFSADYDNYRIAFSGSGSVATGSAFYLRYRASGTDVTSGDYFFGGVYVLNSNSSVLRDYQSSVTTQLVGNVANYARSQFSADVFAPQLAQSKALNASYSGFGATTATMGTVSGTCAAITACDGFTLYPLSGTVTGTVSVYGYKK